MSIKDIDNLTQKLLELENLLSILKDIDFYSYSVNDRNIKKIRFKEINNKYSVEIEFNASENRSIFNEEFYGY